jgi:hypothetical protein
MSLARVLVTWLLLAVLMTANGALRELALKRAMSVPAAEFVSALLGIAIILSVAFFLLRSPPDYPLTSLASISALLVVLTLAFEFGLGALGGKTMSEMLANYRFWEGKLWPLVLLAVAVAPFVGRGRG